MPLMTARMSILALVCMATGTCAFAGRVLKVGEGCEFARPSQAAAVARDGDRIVIGKGVYAGDVCRWTACGLDIRGAGPEATIIDAKGRCCGGKGTWVVSGDGVRISGVAFTGAKCRDRNGAGIRLEGCGLVVSNCLFSANENGILTGASETGRIQVVDSVFRGNGAEDGYSHNIYVGAVRALEMVRCKSDHALAGHCLKSRARENRIIECVFADGDDGRSSYLADFPNGGDVQVRDCRFVQSPAASNGTMLSIGEECPSPGSSLVIRGGSFENRRATGVEVWHAPGVTVRRE